jgi:hypothetical protein
MNVLPQHYPPVPADEKTISDAAVELSHRIVRHAYALEQDIKKETDEEPVSLLLAYGALLLGQCGVYGISPNEAIRAAFDVIGTKPPRARVH